MSPAMDCQVGYGTDAEWLSCSEVEKQESCSLLAPVTRRPRCGHSKKAEHKSQEVDVNLHERATYVPLFLPKLDHPLRIIRHANARAL